MPVEEEGVLSWNVKGRAMGVTDGGMSGTRVLVEPQRPGEGGAGGRRGKKGGREGGRGRGESKAPRERRESWRKDGESMQRPQAAVASDHFLCSRIAVCRCWCCRA